MSKWIGLSLGVFVCLVVGCSSTPSHSGDAGTDGGADAGWTPAQMSGLVLWLNNGTWTLDGGVAVAWPDSSGKAHTFYSAANQQNDPTIDVATIGGRDGVHFSSTGITGMGFQVPVSDFQWGTAPFVTEVVVRPSGCSSPPCPVWISADTGYNFPVGLELNPSLDGGSLLVATASFTHSNQAGLQGSSPPFAGGQVHLLGIRRTDTTTAEVRVDGVPAPFTLSTNVNMMFPAAAIIGFGGLDPAFPTGMDGDIAEVVSSTSAADSDVAQLEAYLKAKYGL